MFHNQFEFRKNKGATWINFENSVEFARLVASIVVEFQNLSTVSEFMGFTIDDPYSVIHERTVRLSLFSNHKCLREIFKFILTDSPELVHKQMETIYRLSEMESDFYE